MKHPIKMLTLFGIFSLISFSCKEDTDPADLCGCDSQTIISYEDIPGTVMRFETVDYLQLEIPDGLVIVEPCEGLVDELKIEGLKIIASGEMKQFCPTGSPNTKVFVPHPFKLTHIGVSESK